MLINLTTWMKQIPLKIQRIKTDTKRNRKSK